MKDYFLPIPFALGPYGVHANSIHDRVLDVGGASSNANNHNHSNLLRSNITVLDPVKFGLYDDDLIEIGEYAKSAVSMMESTAQKIEEIWDDTNRLVVFGGDHSIAMGTGAGLSRVTDMSKVGVVYIDSHGDYNTSELSKSKSITGYPLAVNKGFGHEMFIKHFNNNFVDKVSHIGMRDIDPWEAEMTSKMDLHIENIFDVELKGVREILRNTKQHLNDCDTLWISLDIDVLDPVYFMNGETDVPVPGGMTPRELVTIVSELAKDPRAKVLEIVQLNEVGRTTPLVVLASRIIELFYGLGRERYGE